MTDHHIHACTRCGNVWEHDRLPMSAGEAAYTRAHVCEGCGKDCRMRYDRDVAAGIRETCLSGGDVTAFVARADPMKAIMYRPEEF